jgi:hypothetical protein
MLRCGFHFRDSWDLPKASADEVWRALAHGEDWPLWWKGVSLEGRKLTPGDQPAMGDLGWGRIRGFLPYEFTFVAEATALDPPRLIEAKITGDFEGKWCAVVTALKDGSHVDFDWEATVNLPFPSFLTPILRSIMAFNHAWTIPRGERGLREYLAKRRRHGSSCC